MVYYFLVVLLFLLGIEESTSKNKANLSYWFAVGVIIIIAGLKTSGSTDFLSYKYNFLDTSGVFSWDTSYEPGYQVFRNFFKTIGSSFEFYYFVFALFSIGIKAFVFKKISPCVFPALLIYLCGLFFERDNDGIRQGMSIAFCFLGLYYLINKNNRGFFLSYFLALSFHYSSIIFILAFFLEKANVKDRTIKILVAISFLLCLLNVSLTSFLTVLPFDFLLSKIEMYNSSDEYSVSMGISIGLLFRLCILYIFISYRNIMDISERTYLILRNGFALSLIMSLAFNDFMIFAHRLPYAFREFQIIIIPYIFTAFRSSEKRLVVFFITAIYSFVLLNRYLTGDNAIIYNSYENLLFKIL